EGLACLGTFVAWEPITYQASTPPATGTNFFQGTVPEIDSFTANGVEDLVVEPGTALTLAWTVRNAATIRVHRTGTGGASLDVLNPAGNTTALGPFTETTPVDTEYELVATNRCGQVTARVKIRLRKWPKLAIEGLEVTQGIQVFWRPGVPWNSLATVAGKDTIVRVYISAAMGGFMGDQLPLVTGTLNVSGTILYPINGTSPTSAAANPFITAKAKAAINRTLTNDTLNFRIPASLATGTRTLFVDVRAPAVATAPSGVEVVPKASQSLSWTWTNEPARRGRCARIRDNRPAARGTGSIPTVADADFTVRRAFALLPSPANDIGPAWRDPWQTSQRFGTGTGRPALVADLTDEHECSAWEWLWAWTGATDCPDDDNARWIGLTFPTPLPSTTPTNRGRSPIPGMTLVAEAYTIAMGQAAIQRITPGHELTHSLGFFHVNQSCGGAAVGGPF